jgi:putative ABC transport system permease protein
VRDSLRVLRNAPIFTAVAVLSLALGIGANTAIFSIVDVVMLKALPVTDPQRLVQIGLTPEYANRDWTSLTYPIWETLRDRHGDLFDGALAVTSNNFDENTSGERRTLAGLWVSGSYFDVLGVRPWIGRMLTPADDVRGGGGPDGPVVVISYAFWQSRYGAAPDVLGQRLTLNGQPFTIVGVTPPGFFGVDVGRAFNVAAPFGCEPLLRRKDSMLDEAGSWWMKIIARLRPGQTIESAQAALRAAQPSIRELAVPANASPKSRENFLKQPFELLPASTGTSAVRQRYRIALFTLFVVVALVLLIACANLANLLLARATARQKEFAVRLALGASRPRLIRQLLLESLLIATAGAGLGLLLAQWGSRLLVHQLTPVTQAAQPVVLDLTLDWRVLIFTIAATLITALLFGLAPAFRSTDLSASALMKSTTRSVASGWSRWNLEKTLIATQLAMSLVLVFGASLFVRSFTSLATLDPGFKSERVLVVEVNIRRMEYPEERRLPLYEQVRESMRHVPGVQAMATTAVAIINNGGWNSDIQIDGYTPSSQNDLVVYMNGVGPGYFATMGTALRAGREFTERDTAQAPRVAIVNETFARKYFPGKDGKSVVGQHYTRSRVVREIVGVVQDSKYMNLREEMPPTAFEPTAQDRSPGNGMTYVLRTTGDPASLAAALSRAIADVNKDISFTFTPLEQTIDASLTQERMLAMLAGFFGALALLVAGVGLYGMMSLAVTRRRNELGVRMALGADRRRILTLVLRDVLIVTTTGLLAGTAGSLASSHIIASLLFGITPTDPTTCATAAALLATVAILAAYIPARRAARLDPMIALRED